MTEKLFLQVSLIALLLSFAAFPSILFAEESSKNGISLSVRESLLTAIKNNFDIQILKKVPEIADKDMNIAKSEFDLTLFGEMGYLKSRTPSASAFADPSIGENSVNSASVGVKQKLKPGTSYQLSLETLKAETNSIYANLNPQYDTGITLSLTQPLMKGMGITFNTTNIFVATIGREISRQAYRMSVMQLLTQTSQAYWDMVYLNKEMEVQKESLERAKDFLKRVMLQVDVGVLAPIEIVSAEATVAVREEALIGIRQQIDNNQDWLKALLNIESARPGSTVSIKTVEEPMHQPLELDTDELVDIAIKNRPDFTQAELDLASKKRLSSYYRNQTLPSLNLRGSVTYKGMRGRGNPSLVQFGSGSSSSQFTGTRSDSFSDVGSGRYYDYSVGIVAEYPLFNRLAKNRAGKAELESSMAQIGLKKRKQDIEIDIFRSVRDIKTADERIKASRASRLLAERTLEAEIKKYEVGSSTGFTVLEYQNALAVAKSSEIKALIDFLKARANLELATGTVLKNNDIVLEFTGQ